MGELSKPATDRPCTLDDLDIIVGGGVAKCFNCGKEFAAGQEDPDDDRHDFLKTDKTETEPEG